MMLAATRNHVNSSLKYQATLHTISDHDNEDDNCQSPFKQDGEDDQGDDNINKSGDDVEQDQLHKVLAGNKQENMNQPRRCG